MRKQERALTTLVSLCEGELVRRFSKLLLVPIVFLAIAVGCGVPQGFTQSKQGLERDLRDSAFGDNWVVPHSDWTVMSYTFEPDKDYSGREGYTYLLRRLISKERPEGLDAALRSNLPAGWTATPPTKADAERKVPESILFCGPRDQYMTVIYYSAANTPLNDALHKTEANFGSNMWLSAGRNGLCKR